MFSWRITKYNPQYRNALGRYTKKEWTSVSEVGVDFGGYLLTKEDYIHVEDSYVSAVIEFMNSLKITSLRIKCLEKRNELRGEDYTDEMSRLHKMLKENGVLNIDEIRNIVRMVLRETVWCKLENTDSMFVHFGYDYYMYIGSNKMCKKTIDKIMKMGLFVEPYSSPYLE